LKGLFDRDKLLIIDVSSYIFRAYHALPPLTNKDGLQINAIYGFINMFLKITQEFENFSIVAALDSGREKTFRKKKYEEYKANRKEIDVELRCQFPYIIPMLEALGVPYIEMPGYEADDIIASLTKKFHESDIRIISSDKDLMQLVNDRVFLYDTMKKKTFDADAVQEKFDVPPEKIHALLSLMGDSSDNIPGLPGIGPKTGAKLLNKYETIENIYKNLDELPAKQKEKFVNFKDQLSLSEELVALVYSLEFDIKISEWNGVDEDIFLEFAKEQGFNKLLTKLGITNSETALKPTPKGDVNFIPEGEYYLLKDENEFYISDGISYTEVKLEDIPEDVTVYSFDIKESLSYPFPLFKILDLQIAYFITDSGKHSYSIENISSFLEISSMEIKAIGLKLSALLKIKEKLFELYLKEPQFKSLLEDIEMPNLEVLKGMENFGIGVDIESLKKIKTDFLLKLQKLEEDIYVYSAEEFNINSTQQLSEILFDKLGLPPVGKKKKSGHYSTDHSTLEKLSPLHPIPELVLEHRKLAKLISTYLEPIQEKTDDDNRLHTTFVVTHAATGRLASRDPNLQNIPVRTDEGRKIRTLFPAKDGYTLISLDYSQVELRILAALSEDPELITAFKNGEDIHRKTASAIFNIFPEMVDSEMRRHAKAVNFGIIYGMQAFKLSQDVGVQISFAKEYIEQYFNYYKRVKTFIDSTVEKCKKLGYTETMFGRRRYVPEIKHKNKNLQRGGERVAVNTVIQGTAADIIKLGTIKIHNLIRKENLDAKIILQIHDELIIEVKESEAEKLAPIFGKMMKNAVENFKVPLEVNHSIGKKWSDLK